MKFILINQTFYPDHAATAQRLTDFAVELAKSRHQVTVLTARRQYTEPHALLARNEIYQGVRIVRVGGGFTRPSPSPLPERERGSKMSPRPVCPPEDGSVRFLADGERVRVRGANFLRILDALFVNLSFAWMLFRLPRFDVIVALTSPPLVGTFAAFFANLRRSFFISWLMDINPDEAIEAGWIRKDSATARILEGTLRYTLKQSGRIIVLDHFMKDRLVAKGADYEKIEVVPPWSGDEELVLVPHDKNPFRKGHHLQDKFVVMYAGNHSICHPLDTLLEAAELLKEEASIVFLFIGGGERVRDVLAFKKEKNLKNILYLPYQKREDLQYSLSAADLHTVVMGNPYVGIVHPSKIYGILQIGRPFVFIGPEKSPIGEIVTGQKLGYHVEHREAGRLVDIIHEVKSLKEKALQEIREREQGLAKGYSKKVLVEKLMDCLGNKKQQFQMTKSK